jgi:uncharacterized protein
MHVCILASADQFTSNWSRCKGPKENSGEFLLANGANPGTKGTGGAPPIVLAASLQHGSIVRLLLKAGAEVNVVDESYCSALIWSACWGQTETMKLLLDHVADVNACDQFGGTALMHASRKGHSEAVNLLLERGADVNAAEILGGTRLKAYLGVS